MKSKFLNNPLKKLADYYRSRVGNGKTTTLIEGVCSCDARLMVLNERHKESLSNCLPKEKMITKDENLQGFKCPIVMDNAVFEISVLELMRAILEFEKEIVNLPEGNELDSFEYLKGALDMKRKILEILNS